MPAPNREPVRVVVAGMGAVTSQGPDLEEVAPCQAVAEALVGTVEHIEHDRRPRQEGRRRVQGSYQSAAAAARGTALSTGWGRLRRGEAKQSAIP